MGLGQQYGNNKNYEFKGVSVSSDYSLINTSDNIPKSEHARIKFSYWNSFLKVSISYRKESSFEKDAAEFDNDSELAIYLRHSKARIFYDEINKFIANPDEFVNRGVGSGDAILTISNGKEFGIDAPCIAIRKNKDGVKSIYAYPIKLQFYDAVRNHTEKDWSFVGDLDTYNTVELDILKQQFLGYYEAMTYALAYTVVDKMNYSVYKLQESMSSIANKLGVETHRANNSKKGSGSSYFTHQQSSPNFNKSSIDDLDDTVGSL